MTRFFVVMGLLLMGSFAALGTLAGAVGGVLPSGGEIRFVVQRGDYFIPYSFDANYRIDVPLLQPVTRLMINRSSDGSVSYAPAVEIPCLIHLQTGETVSCDEISHTQLLWFPGMSRIVFDTPFGGDIYTSDLSGANWQPLVAGDYPDLSSDGIRIIFEERIAGSQGESINTINVINIDGTGYQRLLDHARSSQWSPDGKYIAFIGSGGLSIIDAENYEVYVLASDYPSYYKWAPDSSQIVWVESGDLGYQLHVVNLNGEQRAFETFYVDANWGLGWSPDATYVTVNWRPARGSSTIMYIDVIEASTGVVLQTYPSQFNPVWSANSRSMAYISPDGMICVVHIDQQEQHCSILKGEMYGGLQWLP